jgi:streptogramin lyase
MGGNVKKNLVLVVITLFGLLLSGCQAAYSLTESSFEIIETPPLNATDNATPTGEWNPEACIPSVTNFSYPAYIPEILLDPNMPEHEIITPPEPWELVTNLPNMEEEYYRNIFNFVISPNNELWLTANERLYRFNLETHQFTTPDILGVFYTGGESIVVSPDGTLWLTSFHSTYPHGEIGWLSRFDPVEQRFHFVRDNQNLLIDGDYSSMEIAFDQTGELWLLMTGLEDSLFSYDPDTNDAHQYSLPDDYSYINSLTFSPDGALWMIDSSQQVVFNFNPSTGDITPFPFGYADRDGLYFDAPLLGANYYLYFDNEGNLWVSDRGWLEFASAGIPIWNRIIRSPVFITDQLLTEQRYSWLRPFHEFQSSDGIYWFTALNGTVRLDPETGEWCLFTTESSPVVEDSNHTLWMAAYGGMYRYQLQP